MTAQLVLPSTTFRESFLGALREFPPDEPTLVVERELAIKNFDDYVRTCAAWARGERLPHGWVAATTFWLVEDDDYIGSTNIRHELTNWLRDYGGHIGYAIRPARRRQGYGTLICRLALDESRKLGLSRVLITCDADNVGSRKIIESNGGVFEDELPQPDINVAKRRYWIDIARA